ncbi:hypothetical protein C8R44DRAFT_822129 [Mycena epipterygia]|nr:hypothetical protein C8R44DRAFT_822129 [Mycena epipterygia]
MFFLSSPSNSMLAAGSVYTPLALLPAKTPIPSRINKAKPAPRLFLSSPLGNLWKGRTGCSRSA